MDAPRAAIIDILTRQQTAKVFVGDPNQQIYSFRGACNALSQITATHTYHLSRVSERDYVSIVVNLRKGKVFAL